MKYIPKAGGFTRNGKIVLDMDVGHLLSLDFETQQIKYLNIIGYKYNFVDAYIESLVLLDKSAKNVVTYRGK